MGLDLGGALLEKDYNEELRKATTHYGKKGKMQGLLGQLGGYGLQLGTSMLLSPALAPGMMALYGGLANTAGTYLGSKLGGGLVGDYEGGQLGQETIGELGGALDDSLLTSAIQSGVLSGAASYKAGLGAGAETVGAVSEEALEKKIAEAAKTNLPSLEFDTFADPGKITGAKHFMTAPDGTMTPFTDREAIWENIGTQNLSPEYKDYTFSSKIGDTTYDFEWGRELQQAHIDDTLTGGTTAQNLLRRTDLESLGLDPGSDIGGGITLQESLAGKTQDEMMSYYTETQRAKLEPIFREQAALRGMDAEGNYLVDDPADLGPETFEKRLQDMRTLGWDESGGLGGLLGGDDFKLSFQKQPDIMSIDPVTGKMITTPAPSQDIGVPDWLKNNKMMAGIGGAGLLWSLLQQE